MQLDEVNKLSTAQLLGRLQRLRQCEDSLTTSDQTSDGDKLTGSIEFEDSKNWVEAYQQLKMVLAQREHIIKGGQLVKLRQEKAQTQKTADRKIKTRKR